MSPSVLHLKTRRNFIEWLNVSPLDGISSPSTPDDNNNILTLTPSPRKSNTALYNTVLSHTCLPDSLLFTTHMANSPIPGSESVPPPCTPVAHTSTHLQMLASPGSLPSEIPLYDKTLTDLYHTPFELSSANWKLSEPYVSPIIRSYVSAPLLKQPFTAYHPDPLGTTDTPFLTRLLTAFPASPIGSCSPSNPMAATSSPLCTNYSFGSTQSLSDPSYTSQLPGHEDSGWPNNRAPSPSFLATDTMSMIPGGGPAEESSNLENLLCSIPLSPLTPISDDSFVTPRKHGTKRKRFTSDSPTPLTRLKKSRSEAVPPASRHTDTARSIVFPQRTFPKLVDFEFHVDFALFYRRFPLSAFFQFEDNQQPPTAFKAQHPGGTYNPPRNAFDLYTPRFVKGMGKTKVGLCPICIEAPERGGEGKKVWLSMKFSAFKCNAYLEPSYTDIYPSYHMQYGHGISANTALPFSPPTNFRVTVRPRPAKLEKSEIVEGKCHKCRKWVAIQGVKEGETRVKELFWWKHAAVCHRGSNIDGEGDFYVVDSVYKRLRELDK